jgi:hypothetical protein
MRATLATAVLVAAWLMTALALTSAQSSAGDQEKGSTGWSGGSKDQPQLEHWDAGASRNSQHRQRS